MTAGQHLTRSVVAAVVIAACTSMFARRGAAQGAAVAPGMNLIAPAQAQADLAQLRVALYEAHGAPDRFVSKTELDRRWADYRAAITQPVTQFQLLGITSRMLADLGDGHARAGLDSASARLFLGARLLPLRVRIESGNRLVVIGNDSPADTVIAPGAELLRINGRTVSDILADLAPQVPHDGFINSGRDARLSRGFPTLYHQLIDQRAEFDVTVRTVAGATRDVHLAGITDSIRAQTKNPLNAEFDANVAKLDGSRDNISIRFPGDGTVGVLRIHGFGGDRFVAELDSVMGVAFAHGVRGMVLDLRGNGGGVDMYGANLSSRFTDKSFRYFDHIHIATTRPSFTTFLARTYAQLDSGTVRDPKGGWLVLPRLHPGVSEQSAAPMPFVGPLVVLMDGGTFSTAADVTATIRGFGKATFVGEESGGAYEGNTSGSSALLTLKNSGIRVSVQMYGYVNAAPAPREHGRGTLPDIALPLTVRDILRGTDPAMTRALAIASATRR